MKASCLLLAVAIAGAVAAGVLWNGNHALRAEIGALKSRNAELEQQLAGFSQKNEAESVRVKEQSAVQTKELVRLRGEVNQLRTGGAREVQQLRAENAALKHLAQKNGAAESANAAPAVGSAANSFPRESWSFAGYATPENALVSAIWAMREGDPKTYLNSLAGEERKRIEQEWATKTPEQIAAKHQGDVSKINGMQVVDRQEVSPTEMTMNVYIGGTERMEKVRMLNVDGEWKFAGYIRPPPRQAPVTPAPAQ